VTSWRQDASANNANELPQPLRPVQPFATQAPFVMGSDREGVDCVAESWLHAAGRYGARDGMRRCRTDWTRPGSCWRTSQTRPS
jgi:hypothetical protein